MDAEPRRRLHRARAPVPAGVLLLGRYRLEEPLGAGSFGTVWRAHDTRLERDVAVKLLPGELLDDGRFQREARAAARLAHPGIVTLYEAAVDERGAYLVSELVHGATLAGLMRRAALSAGDVLRIGAALAGALEHAHALGVVHRDVKPANILVPERPGSEAGVAKLTDFGVARLLDAEALTHPGDVIGSAAYMAPEQADGAAAGPEADAYSLGVVLYEALTGTNPQRESVAGGRRRQAPRFPSLARACPELTPATAAAIEDLLPERPRDRIGLAALHRELTAAGVGSRHGLTPPPRGARRRERAPDLLPATGVLPATEPLRAPDDAQATWHLPSAEDAATVAAVGLPGEPGVRVAGEAPPRSRPAAAGAAALRLGGGLLTAALAGWLWRRGHAAGVLPWWAPALPAGALWVFVPRLAWCALALGLGTADLAAGRAGLALLTVTLLALPVALLPLKPRVWPLVMLPAAPGLVGAAYLAGGWPALAGRARGSLTRAGLGAGGWLVLLVAGPLHRTGLFPPLTRATALHPAWPRSLALTAHAVLEPLLSSGAVGGAAVWGLAALALPWLVRGRRPAHDAGLAVFWAAGTAVAMGAVLGVSADTGAFAASDRALTGAAAACLLALVPALLFARRSGRAPAADGHDREFVG